MSAIHNNGFEVRLVQVDGETEYPYLDDSSGQRHFVMQYNSEFLVVVYSPVPFSARAVVAGEYVGYNVYQDKPHSWALIKGWKNDKSGQKRLPFKCVKTKPFVPASKAKPLRGDTCSIEVTFFDFELQDSAPFDNHQPYLPSTDRFYVQNSSSRRIALGLSAGSSLLKGSSFSRTNVLVKDQLRAVKIFIDTYHSLVRNNILDPNLPSNVRFIPASRSTDDRATATSVAVNRTPEEDKKPVLSMVEDDILIEEPSSPEVVNIED